MKTRHVGVAAVLLATGCAAHHPAEPTYAPVAPRTFSAQASPPWSPFQMAAALLTSTVALRPIDVELVRRRMQSVGLGPKPIQLADGSLVMTASEAWPRLVDSPVVARKSGLRNSGNLPAAVDLRGTNLDGPMKNQQMVGVCWSFALSSIMDNALRRQGRTDVVAPLHLIATNAWNDLHKDGSTRPMTSESAWPYDPRKACELTSPRDVWCGDAYHVTPGSWRSDPQLSAEVDVANAHGSHHVTKFQSIDPPSFDAIADELASGHEVYAAFRIDERFFGHPKGDIIEDYASEERGPHATTIVGYRTNGPRGREVLIKNSWGPSWGAGGYAWMSERGLRDHGGDFFTVEIADEGGVRPPVPPPITPPPASDPRPIQWPIPFMIPLPPIPALPPFAEMLPH
jgi:hypothetical protein